MDGDDDMNNANLRHIPKKNYLFLGVIILVTFLLVYYLYMWYDAYKDTKLNMRILDSYMEVINYNELDNYLVESPNTIIYVSVLEDENIRNFEKSLKKELKSNNINKSILYMDITNDITNSGVRLDMINKYSLNGINMTNVPAILVIKNGKLDAIYSIRDNNYDVEEVKSYINNIIFNSEGD